MADGNAGNFSEQRSAAPFQPLLAAYRGRSSHAAHSASLKLFLEISRNRRPQQKGFTLIEIVIVIAIIIIISTLGVGSYSSINNNLAIDFFADNFISKLHSTRVSTQSQPKCLGLRLQKDAEVKATESAYKNARTGCEKNKKTTTLDLGKNIVASQILLDGIETESVDIFFEPPAGIMKFSPDGKNIEIIFALVTDATKTRTVTIEKNTGKIAVSLRLK